MARTHYYISEKAVEGLRLYEYQGVDGSLLSPIFDPFWNWCTSLFPPSVPPNVITFISFVVLVSGFLVIVPSQPNYLGETSPIACLLFGLSVFLFQTFDAVDGKHARKHDQYSPLGDFFDHGCDSLSAVNLAAVGCCFAAMGDSGLTIICIFLAVAFIAALFMWEQYVTKRLRFTYFNSPTELLVMFEICVALTVLDGNRFWKRNMFWWSEALLGRSWNVPMHDFFIGLAFVLTPVTSIDVVGVVRRCFTEKQSCIGGRVGIPGGKLRPKDAVAALLPLLWITAWYGIWVVMDWDFFMMAPVWFSVSYAVLSAYFSTRLIVYRLTLEKAPWWYVLELPIPFVVISCILLSNEFLVWKWWILKVFVGFLALCYVHLIYFSVTEIAAGLKMKVFGVNLWSQVRRGGKSAEGLQAYESEDSEASVGF